MKNETINEKNENNLKEKLSGFTFVRLKLPRLIPQELIELVKGKTFTPEQFYKYQEEQAGNPYNFLFALIDQEKKIQGYIWSETNALDGSLFVNTYSVRKEYWNKGDAIPKAIEFLKELKKKTGAKKVFWVSTNDKFYVKHGFKRSKNVLLEYDLN